MNAALNQWGPAAVIVGGYLLGIYFQNRRIDDLRDSMNKRFDDLRDLLKSEVSGSKSGSTAWRIPSFADGCLEERAFIA